MFSIDSIFQTIVWNEQWRLTVRAVPDLYFSNPAGAEFCWIWNDKSSYPAGAGAGAGFSN